MHRLKVFLLFIFLLGAAMGFSQPAPITWSALAQQQGLQKYIVRVHAVISSGWYIYAAPDQADELTELQISWENENISPAGELKNNGRSVRVQDKIFKKPLPVFENSVEFTQPVLVKGNIPSEFKISLHGFMANGKEFQPIDEDLVVLLPGGVDSKMQLYSQLKLSTVDLNRPASNCGMEQNRDNDGSLLILFFLGMAGGLIALLTPCVFPMIPVTVSYFTGKARSRKEGIRNAIFYAAFIFGIYILASLPFHLLSGISPEIFNNLATNVWVNIAFFVIFILFSLSFFGLFEIVIPASLATKTDAKGNIGSMAGIFFMALTLAIVSFSCTGPILGSLLVESLSTSVGASQLTAGMAGFGLALALPFGLFAMFPGWLKRLPKGGGWLDNVKKILAFVELALAFKFLSNADLVEHWGILKREVFIGIWVLISAALTIYLVIEYNRTGQSSKYRQGLIILSIAFTLYLLPGLTNSRHANLKLLSGLAPPLSYSVYSSRNAALDRLHADLVNDFEGALRRSKLEHKPILIDFTGWACVNCRKMEEQVWTDPEVMDLIKNKFILVSLYVDDRKKLPVEEQFRFRTKDSTEKEIVTQGDKWAVFQAENFGQVTQPLYVILSPGEKLLNSPVGYTPDAKIYKQWLNCGLQAN
jgi:thiol:disulfide interchange protein DsbD